MESVVITRHPALFQYLKELGLVTDDTPLITHATVDDVKGKHVYGVLPMRLAAEADCLTEVSLDIPYEMRGLEIKDVESLKTYNPTLTTYKVKRV